MDVAGSVGGLDSSTEGYRVLSNVSRIKKGFELFP